MKFLSKGRKIISVETGKSVALATHPKGAEIICKAMNEYFESPKFTENETIEMMHKNNASSLNRIADFCEKNEYDPETIIEFLRETAEEMAAQAEVVAIRAELKLGKPKD